MPRTTKKTTKVKNSSKDDLMEFEQFVAQKRESKKSNGKGLLPFSLFLLIVSLLLVLFVNNNTKPRQYVNPSYKTIYLENGQQFYAKIVKEDPFYIYIDDVFYIRNEQVELPPVEEDGDSVVETRAILVPRGQEPNSPVGYMQLNRSKVMAIDEIGPNSEILKGINDIKNNQ